MSEINPTQRFAKWVFDQVTPRPHALVPGAEQLRGNAPISDMIWRRVVLFDVIDVPPFDLLARLDDYLEQACEIIIGEPPKQKTNSELPPLDWKQRFRSMAQRFGFSESDVKLRTSNRFETLILQRSQRPAFRLGKITAQNANEMRDLFSRIFGHAMSEAFWRWKYMERKAQAMGLWQDDKLIAHYGGLREDILLDGKSVKAMQMVDVMVDPSVRHLARRQSPFFILTGAFTECHVGWHQPHLLAFGFPSDRHLQLAEHLKLYAPVGKMSEIVFAERKRSLFDKWFTREEIISKENFDEVKADLDLLWQQMRSAMPDKTIVEKDAARILRRYITHPQIQYRIHLIRRRWSKKPLAVVVLKEQQDKMLLMDIIGATSAFAKAITLVQSQIREHDNKSLCMWVSSSCIETLVSHDDTINTLPISIPTITWTEGPKPEQLRDRWWLTAGDTDFL